MATSVPQTAALRTNAPKPTVGRVVLVALAVWLTAVLILGARGAFLGAPGKPPLALFAAAVTPIVLFAVAIRRSASLRDFLRALDLRMLVAVQGWRYAGFGFIALYSNHVLPGLFAWPAGVGDMAIGLAAPFWVAALNRDPDAAASGRFLLWNLLGIADFVIAFATATICAMTITEPNVPSITPMGLLPLVLIPTFMVPLFVMVHIATLMKRGAEKVAA